MKTLILAGGFGTRMRPLTDTVPKPMLPLAGKPILEYTVKLCRQNGLVDIIIATHYLPEKIRDYFGNGSRFGVSIQYTQEEKPLGSAGAIQLNRKKLGDSFMVLNGDTYIDLGLQKILNFHSSKRAMATLVVHKTSHPEDSDLVQTDKDSRVTFFGRSKELSGKLDVGNAGIFIFSQEVFDFIPVNQVFSIEKDLIPCLIEKNLALYAYWTADYIKDIGTPERYKEVNELVSRAS